LANLQQPHRKSQIKARVFVDDCVAYNHEQEDTNKGGFKKSDLRNGLTMFYCLLSRQPEEQIET
jgi:hypothetical protein